MNKYCINTTDYSRRVIPDTDVFSCKSDRTARRTSCFYDLALPGNVKIGGIDLEDKKMSSLQRNIDQICKDL